MTPGVHGNNLLLVAPLRKWTNICSHLDGKNPLRPQFRPGDRLADMAPSYSDIDDMGHVDTPYFIYGLSHPKKEGSDEFHKWYQSFTDATGCIINSQNDVLVVE